MPRIRGREELRGDIAEVLERTRGIDPASITDDARLAEDLGLDSLALAELGFALLAQHGVTLDDNDILRMRTIGDVLDVVEERDARLPDGPG